VPEVDGLSSGYIALVVVVPVCGASLLIVLLYFGVVRMRQTIEVQRDQKFKYFASAPSPGSGYEMVVAPKEILI
jgi:uncharacterized membrane-anchored protein